MDADDFRDHMLSFLFLRSLSDNCETTAKRRRRRNWARTALQRSTALCRYPCRLWCEGNLNDVPAFEKEMRRKVHCVVQPQHL